MLTFTFFKSFPYLFFSAFCLLKERQKFRTEKG